jgi:hypothetical protein
MVTRTSIVSASMTCSWPSPGPPSKTANVGAVLRRSLMLGVSAPRVQALEGHADWRSERHGPGGNAILNRHLLEYGHCAGPAPATGVLRPVQKAMAGRSHGVRTFGSMRAMHRRVTRHPRGGVLVCVAIVACLTFAASACASTTGTVVGSFGGAGGLTGRPFTYSSGTVTLSGPTGTYQVRIDAHGNFTLTVPPGTYHVSGRTPGFNSGQFPCAGPDVVVQSGATTHANVTCHLF